MIEKFKTKRPSKYLLLMVIFLLVVNVSLGYLLVRQAKNSITTLIHTRMLDISNTAAAMIDGDALRAVTPEDAGTEAYETIMRTLTYFQDNIDLKYIYCVRVMEDGTFTFGLDPTVDDPGEFGSPVVYTDALYRASRGVAAADDEFYQDAWGTFYSAYSPVFDSAHQVAGVIAVDFDAAWFNEQLAVLSRTTIIVALLSLLVGGAIVTAIVTRSQRQIQSIHGQLNELESALMKEMGSSPIEEEASQTGDDTASIDALGKHIQIVQDELKTQIAQVHGQAYQDGLTGVKSTHAYLEMEKAVEKQLTDGTLTEFAIVVCDVNGLKQVNDTLGHKAGDELIRRACQMVCDIFAHSPVYRVGGDEFTVFLTGRDYEHRRRLMEELHKLSSDHIATKDAIVSGGMAEFIPGRDTRISDVFKRADEAMYAEKQLLKNLGAVTRGDEIDRARQEAVFQDLLDAKIRRHILIADDIQSNREMLGDLLQEDYDILYASDGIETLAMLRQHKDEIALLILDLYMPNMTGREVLTEMQIDPVLVSIPVIVLTVDQEAELDCLRIGAMDFIPKPFPDMEIVKARSAQGIELSENRDLIRHTRRDKLTGLLNIDYFMSYVERFDQQNPDAVLDAMVCDINEFHAVNENYGRQFGDLVLRSIGISMNKLARRTGGISCRKGDDTFLLYCPHQKDYEQLLTKFMAEVFVEKETTEKVKLRFGVYTDAGKEDNLEKRFALAEEAANSVKNDPQKLCGYYDIKR
jgi:diguanylate cyclase (GGDEF)-like protein